MEPVALSKIIEKQKLVNRIDAQRDGEDPLEHEKLYRVAAVGIYDGLQEFLIYAQVTLGTSEEINAPESLINQLRGKMYTTGMTVHHDGAEYVIARLVITDDRAPKKYTYIDCIEEGQVIPNKFKLETIELVPKRFIDLEN